MNICIIPARIGSKRIREKNIRLFLGKPMIQYAIEVAKKSKIFQKIIVSTDSVKVENIALKCGAEVPFLRPFELSQDSTPTIPVIQHSIEFFEKRNIDFKFVCCLYPCSPLIEAEDLKRSFEIMINSPIGSCFPVCQYPSPIERALTVGKNNAIQWVNSEHKFTRTQDLNRTFFDSGTFYWATKEKWIEGDISSSCAYIMSSARVCDIDNEDDWETAEKLYRLSKEQF